MATTHRRCRNFAALDVVKGLCHVRKERVAADDESCEEFEAMPRCALCASFEPASEPHLGVCTAEASRPMTYPDLVGLHCEHFAWAEGRAGS